MLGTKSGGCDGCTSQREENLVRLGLQPDKWDYLVALAGNPNTGKSTVFNQLTGLRQHTGNWPGKTVVRAEGVFAFADSRVKVVDLPGTYSLQAGSEDEEVARDFILFGQPDVTLLVMDATRLERNLNLALQVLAITDRVVICLNLMDEARRHGVAVSAEALEKELGVPVVPAVARSGQGMDDLLEAIHRVATGQVTPKPFRIERFDDAIEQAVDELVPEIELAFPGLPNVRWVALRLLNADQRVEQAVRTGEIGQLRPDAVAAVLEVSGVGGATGSTVVADDVDLGLAAAVLEHASRLRWTLPSDFHDSTVASIYKEAGRIAIAAAGTTLNKVKFTFDATLDRLLTSRVTGFPIMLAILMTVFWLTIAGANVPSAMLADLLLETVHPWLKGMAAAASVPWWISGFFLDGVYLATAWVISVMLPPMAIFFPLFTLLEDFGYLPRVAFNLDSLFRTAGAHGKQALTMTMGFGCNAAGIVATRIIDSPRERLIAIITNNFSLCNGRWPTQILLATIFIGALAPAHLAGFISAAAVVGVALLGIVLMFLTSWALSRTVLRGEASTFSLELPPYRPPRIMQTLYTSLIDRTLIVLWRAIVFAAPAGAAIWLVSNIQFGGVSMAELFVGWSTPFALLVGLNGVILLAYIVAIPANEIVIPTILMLTVLTAGMTGVGGGTGVMFELDSAADIGVLLQAGGWTLLTAVNVMLFSLLHNPCSTTIYTIYKETRSAKWTTVASVLPVVMGFGVTFLVTQVARLMGVGG